MILAIRTDKPEAELYLLDTKFEIIADHKWLADRTLADNLLAQINKFLHTHQCHTSGLSGIVIFTGQGSFTGLRIGTAVANAFAYSLNIPIIATAGENWLAADALAPLDKTKLGQLVTPRYDRSPNIT